MRVEPHKKIWNILDIRKSSGVEMLRGILDFRTDRHNWEIELDIHPAAVTPDRVRELIKTGLDGVILTMPCPPETQRMIASSKVPVVCINVIDDALALRDAPTRFVWTDNAAIGNAAAAHLLSCGDFSAYAFLGLRDMEWSEARLRGFGAELARAGKRPERFAASSCPMPREEAAELRRFLKELPKPAALFTAYDELSLAAVKVARSARIRIPDHLCIIGVDDTENIVEPLSLSSIRLRFSSLGYRAAAALHRMMTKRTPTDEPISIDSLDVIRRKSTRINPDKHTLAHEIRACIEKHACSTDCTAGTIAAHFNLSRSTIEHRFREAEGISLHRAVIEERLNAAARKLKTVPDLPLSVVASACGFPSAKTLSRLWKARFGTSPRRRHGDYSERP